MAYPGNISVRGNLYIAESNRVRTYRPATGAPAPGSPDLAETPTKPTVTIGGVAADVWFSGLTPGTVGLYQVDASVPQGVQPGGAVPVVISIGGVQSNTVTIAVSTN